jgi:hypothetical protein
MKSRLVLPAFAERLSSGPRTSGKWMPGSQAVMGVTLMKPKSEE